ncbi:hypothetical protein [Cytobacillus oceanisediminis]|uniref:hypothetical protein n=1 Tax=Cytobacillus oceanisediminis TaxID=665099 RepID=UPI0020B23C20|nr:hypothetical protein [Cytobacillus oceanisediminis]
MMPSGFFRGISPKIRSKTDVSVKGRLLILEGILGGQPVVVHTIKVCCVTVCAPGIMAWFSAAVCSAKLLSGKSEKLKADASDNAISLFFR